MRHLIYLGFVGLFLSSCMMGVNEVFLIPDGYEGPVIVRFNEVAGIPIEMENGKRIFKVPQSGILKSEENLQKGYRDIEYFYIDGSGNTTEIESVQIQLLDDEEKIANDVKIYRLLVYGNGDISFIVGKLKDSEKHWEALEKLKKEVYKDDTVIHTKGKK